MKFLKILAWGFGLLALLVVLAAIAVRIFFPTEKIKTLIVENAQLKLNRQVRIDSLSLHLFRGLRLNGLQVSERPTFENGTFLSVAKIYFRPQLLPLLSKRVFIDVVALQAPVVQVVRESDGSFNFSDLVSSSTTPAAAPSPKPSPFSFLVSKVSVSGGSLQFVDRSTAALTMGLKDVNVLVKHSMIGRPVEFNATCAAMLKGIEAQVDSKITSNVLEGTARIEKVTVTRGKSSVEISGDISGLKSSEPLLNMGWTLSEMDLGILRPLKILPELMGLAGHLNGRGTIKGGKDGGEFTASLDGKDLDVRYGTATFHKAPGVALAFNGAGRYQLPLTLDLREMQLQLAQIVMKGTATYSSSGYRSTLQSNEFPLESLSPLLPPLNGITLGGPCRLNLAVKSTAAGPDLKGTATAHDATINAKGVKLSEVKTNVDFTTKDTAGSLTASGLEHEFFYGKNVSFNWNLVDVMDLAKMNGNASMKMGPGNIKNIDKLTGRNPIAEMLLLPFGIIKKATSAAKHLVRLPNLDGLEYQSIVGDYAFHAGTMDVKKIAMDATGVAAGLKGKIGLIGERPINADAQLALAENVVRGTLGKILNNPLGAITVNLSIKGTVSDPKTRIDLIDTSKSVLGAVGNTATEPIKQLDNLFKSLFKK